MTDPRLENLNVAEIHPIPSPEAVKDLLRAEQRQRETVLNGRETVRRILAGRDRRLLAIVGPCSIHDPAAALEYAGRLGRLASELEDELYLVMRVYFEKPRSAVGWKGLINDPHLDDSFRIEEGLKQARRLLLSLADTGVPAASEALDPISPQYLADLIAWSAIGARTVESQTHREMASGLSMPIGVKNSTDGSISGAINAMLAIARPHRFLGIDEHGACSVVETRGNSQTHIVLRGGLKPNYDAASVAACESALRERALPPNIMIDCSHGNSGKDPARQEAVLQSCMGQALAANSPIIGVMIESNLEWGNQAMPKDVSSLRYGVSITDACVDWTTTQRMLRDAARKLSGARRSRSREPQADVGTLIK